MIINFGKKLRIASDERQYIIQERKKVNRTNKETNEIEESYEWMNKGYYGDLKYVLRAIPHDLIKENDDVNYIKEQLDNIYKNIDVFEDAYIEDIKCLKEDKEKLKEEIFNLRNKVRELEKEK